MATLDKLGYRKYLNEKGFKDDEITYDANNQSVMAKGKFFGNAAPAADGSTYDTKGNLESMYKAYQTQNMPTYQDKSNALLDQAQTKLGQPAKPFQYNAQSDPLYLNAMQAAQTGAATQQGNTLAKLRSMGQGKSSYSEGVANQIGQQAVADVNSKVLPQLTSQAYQRYMDEQQMGQQQFGNMLQLGGVYNNLGQQGLDNDFRNQQFGEQKKQNNLSAANQVGQQLGRVLQPKDDYENLYNQGDAPLNLQGQQIEYGKARDQIGDEQSKLKFDEDVRQFGLQYGLQKASQDNSFANARADNTRADEANKLAREKFEYDKKQSDSKVDNDFQEEERGLVDALRGGDLTPAQAYSQIGEDQKLGFYTPEQANRLRAMIEQLSPSVQKAPELTATQRSEVENAPNPSQMERLYKEQGQGKPMLDWMAWYRDPNGRIGGVDFDTWARVSGPRLGARK